MWAINYVVHAIKEICVDGSDVRRIFQQRCKRAMGEQTSVKGLNAAINFNLWSQV